MKNLILPLVTFFLFIACEEENPQPVKDVDPFVGSWYYTDSYTDIDIEVSFTVTKTADGYAFSNIEVDYPEIASNETLTYKIEVIDPFADGKGFGEIKIIGSNDATWIHFILTYNSIYKDGGKSVMSVRDMEIQMINRQPVMLEQQVFIKSI